MRYIFVTFDELFDALTFERAMKKHKLNGKLVSVPRELSSGCGYAWRTSEHSIEELTAYAGDLHHTGMHELMK